MLEGVLVWHGLSRVAHLVDLAVGQVSVQVHGGGVRPDAACRLGRVGRLALEEGNPGCALLQLLVGRRLANAGSAWNNHLDPGGVLDSLVAAHGLICVF